jgi:hypothetical protein
MLHIIAQQWYDASTLQQESEVNDEIELPPLPEPDLLVDCGQSMVPGYTIGKLQQYRDALRHALREQHRLRDAVLRSYGITGSDE